MTDLGLNKGRGGFFKFFGGSLWFRIKIKVFLPVNAKQGWLDNVSGIPLTTNWSAGFGTFLQAPVLDSHWLKYFADGTPSAGRNDHSDNRSEACRTVAQ